MTGPTVRITLNGVGRDAPAGRSVAAALLSLGIRALRTSPRAGTPRGAFCMMGVCQECLVRVDGRVAQSCMVMVADGMRVALDIGDTGPG